MRRQPASLAALRVPQPPRTPKAFLALGRKSFADVQGRLVGDTLRIPSSHFLMTLEKPF
jgi:hypothetical protein